MTTPMQGKAKDGWDKAKIIADILKIVVILYIGSLVNISLKSREIGLNYVQLATGILQNEPNEESKHLRNWAIDVINEYSKVRLNKKARNELQDTRLIIVPPYDGLMVTDDMSITDEGIIMKIGEGEISE